MSKPDLSAIVAAVAAMLGVAVRLTVTAPANLLTDTPED